MKRVLIGAAWFVLLSTLGLGTAVAMGDIRSTGPVHKRYVVQATSGFSWDKVAGIDMVRRNGPVIVLAAFVLSVVGTATGTLAGTRRREVLSSDRDYRR